MKQLRILWSVAALLFASAFLLVQTGVPAALGQDATSDAATAPAPDWTFVVHGMQDPYAEALTTPAQPAAGMRYVGFDVEVVNDSDQPLNFSSTGVYLRDEDGFSYRSGAVSGRGPALKGRTMPVGERARGWVWFEVPQDATLTEILLVPTAPELRVGLDEVASIAGTPGGATTTEVITPAPEATATQAVTPEVTPDATEPPAAAATSTAPPAAPQVPTSVIIVESEETTEGEVAATATPEPTSPPEVTPTPAIVTSAPTEPPIVSGTAIEPGATVVNADSDANVRSGPSLEADIVVTIPIGSELTVTGPAVAEGNSLWWPVLVAETGEEGYISEDLLSLVGG